MNFNSIAKYMEYQIIKENEVMKKINKIFLLTTIVFFPVTLASCDSSSPSTEVTKLNYDMSKVKFENKTVTYDGRAHKLEITGTLPNGVSVTYTNNKLVDVGTLEVIATFKGDYEKYNEIPDMTATLTIVKGEYDLSAITFENKEVCPFCGGEELYDLTHDKMFDRNKKDEPQKEEVKEEDEEMDLFSNDFSSEEEFDNKPVDLSKVTIEEPQKEEVKEEIIEDDSSLITDDDFSNSDIIVHEAEKEEEDNLVNLLSSEENNETLIDESINDESLFETKESENIEENINEEPLLNEEDIELSNPFDDLPFEKEEEEKVTPLDEEIKEVKEEVIEETKVEPLNLTSEPLEEVKETNDERVTSNEVVEEEKTIEKQEVKEEKDTSLSDLKEERNKIIDKILILSILNNKNDLSLEKLSLSDSLILNEVFDEISKLNNDENESLLTLFNKKYELDKEIFALEKTPLNGYLLYKDEELLKEITKENKND